MNHCPLLHRGMRARLPYQIADLCFVTVMRRDLRLKMPMRGLPKGPCSELLGEVWPDVARRARLRVVWNHWLGVAK